MYQTSVLTAHLMLPISRIHRHKTSDHWQVADEANHSGSLTKQIEVFTSDTSFVLVDELGQVIESNKCRLFYREWPVALRGREQ